MIEFANGAKIVQVGHIFSRVLRVQACRQVIRRSAEHVRPSASPVNMLSCLTTDMRATVQVSRIQNVWRANNASLGNIVIVHGWPVTEPPISMLTPRSAVRTALQTVARGTASSGANALDMNLAIDPVKPVAHAQQARTERQSGKIALERELSTLKESVIIVVHYRAAKEIIVGLNRTRKP